MSSLYVRLPRWLKILAGLILSIIILIVFVNIYSLYRVYVKYPELVRALELGEQMLSNDNVGENCSYVDFEHFPELKARSIVNLAAPEYIYDQQKYRLKVTDTNCIRNAKLINIGYQHGHAIATYTCQKDDVITEFTWTDFKDSCSYMEYLKSWNLPMGKYSLLSVSRP